MPVLGKPRQWWPRNELRDVYGRAARSYANITKPTAIAIPADVANHARCLRRAGVKVARRRTDGFAMSVVRRSFE